MRDVTEIGPKASVDVTMQYCVVSKGLGVTPGQTYIVFANLSGLQLASAGAVKASLEEAVSGFSVTLIPLHVAHDGDAVFGTWTGLWVPEAGQDIATFKVNASSSAGALRFGLNSASISVRDLSQ